MRALARIATPVAVLVSGCAFPVDDFRAPARSDVGLSTNGDAANYGDGRTDPDSEELDALDLDTGLAVDSGKTPADAGADACVCLRQSGGKCKEWSPPDCAK